jgi:hypothetical protein
MHKLFIVYFAVKRIIQVIRFFYLNLFIFMVNIMHIFSIFYHYYLIIYCFSPQNVILFYKHLV